MSVVPAAFILCLVVLCVGWTAALLLCFVVVLEQPFWVCVHMPRRVNVCVVSNQSVSKGRCVCVCVCVWVWVWV